MIGPGSTCVNQRAEGSPSIGIASDRQISRSVRERCARPEPAHGRRGTADRDRSQRCRDGELSAGASCHPSSAPGAGRPPGAPDVEAVEGGGIRASIVRPRRRQAVRGDDQYQQHEHQAEHEAIGRTEDASEELDGAAAVRREVSHDARGLPERTARREVEQRSEEIRDLHGRDSVAGLEGEGDVVP